MIRFGSIFSPSDELINDCPHLLKLISYGEPRDKTFGIVWEGTVENKGRKEQWNISEYQRKRMGEEGIKPGDQFEMTKIPTEKNFIYSFKKL